MRNKKNDNNERITKVREVYEEYTVIAPNVCLLDVFRDVTIDLSSQFGEEIAASANGSKRLLILNFPPEVRFDSGGSATLVDFINKNRGIKVVISGNYERVQRLMGYAKLDRQPSYRETDREALKEYFTEFTTPV